jgi:hypothetical protein
MKFFEPLAALIGPEAAATTLDLPNVVSHLANNSGTDLSNIKSKEEVQEMVAQAGSIANQSLENEGIETNEEEQPIE